MKLSRSTRVLKAFEDHRQQICSMMRAKKCVMVLLTIAGLFVPMLPGFTIRALASSELLATISAGSSGSDQNSLVSLNQATGGQTLVGGIGQTQNILALALNPKTDTLYGLMEKTSGNETDYEIAQVNTSTGVTTALTTITVDGSPTVIRSIAFSADGTLYGWSSTQQGIGTIDLNSGIFSPVFSTPSGVNYAAIAFSPTNDNLYAVYTYSSPSFAQYLVAIDMTTLTTLSSIQAGNDNVETMVFTPDGSTIYFTNFSYTLGSMNPTTGEQTSVGSGRLGALAGIAFVNIGSLWQSAISFQNGWDWVKWFGYFNVTNSPWIYHDTLGWLYPFGTDTSSIWFWDTGMKAFWWTSATVYPWVYRASDGTWLYYDVGSSNPRWFYNLKYGKWEQD